MTLIDGVKKASEVKITVMEKGGEVLLLFIWSVIKITLMG